MTIRWQIPPSQAFAELTTWYIEAITQGVYLLAQRRAPEIETWMKQNHVWTDRTGNATQTLNTEAQLLATQAVSIQLAHGVEYGIFLELANAGHYAIIGPALDHWAPIIWQDVQDLLRH